MSHPNIPDKHGFPKRNNPEFLSPMQNSLLYSQHMSSRSCMFLTNTVDIHDPGFSNILGFLSPIRHSLLDRTGIGTPAGKLRCEICHTLDHSTCLRLAILDTVLTYQRVHHHPTFPKTNLANPNPFLGIQKYRCRLLQRISGNC